jgi:purine-binding chemotaxis protein CheW
MKTMTAPAESAPAPRKLDQRAGKYLTFGLGNEEFAIQVLPVREIMGIQEITLVPQTPGYIKGVLNLRGRVVPMVDLRLKLGLPELEYNQRTCIIVAKIESPAGKLMVGIIVDGVSEVLTLDAPDIFEAADIEDPPDFGSGLETPYILGMAKIKNKMRILLNINMVFSASEVRQFGSLTE